MTLLTAIGLLAALAQSPRKEEANEAEQSVGDSDDTRAAVAALAAGAVEIQPTPRLHQQRPGAVARFGGEAAAEPETAVGKAVAERSAGSLVALVALVVLVALVAVGDVLVGLLALGELVGDALMVQATPVAKDAAETALKRWAVRLISIQAAFSPQAA